MKAHDYIQNAIKELYEHDEKIKTKFYESIDDEGNPINDFHQAHHKFIDWIQRLNKISEELTDSGLLEAQAIITEVTEHDCVFYIRHRDVPGEARSVVVANGFRVLKGSFISPTLIPNMYEIVKRLRQENAKFIDSQHRLLSDIDFDNAGQAARFVIGKQVNGLEEWKTADDVPLKIYNNSDIDDDSDSLKRPEAVKICETNGIDIGSNFTLAKSHKSRKHYWANPSASYLLQEWWVLLNDDIKRELHVFCVPANSISANEMWIRRDKTRPNSIDMRIRYENESFQDIRSKINFSKWLVKSIKY